MRRVLAGRANPDDDLPVLAVDDLEWAPAMPSRRPSWAQVAGFALALVAVGALVMIVWLQHDQDRLARHQACVMDAEAKGILLQPGPPSPGVQAAVARCFPNPRSLLASAGIEVPGVVGSTVGSANDTLVNAGLLSEDVKGPGGGGAYVVKQQPLPGTMVPAFTIVHLTTGPSPSGVRSTP
jgi:hypothetical protein